MRRFLGRIQYTIKVALVRSYRSFAELMRTPRRWFGAAWYFIRHIGSQWQNNKRFRELLFGLPALGLFSTFIYFGIAAWYQDRSTLVSIYDRAGNDAAAVHNQRAAKLCLERVIQIRGESPETLLKLAQLYAEENDGRRVAALLTRLAPVDKPTIPEAHIWRAQSLLAKRQLTKMELAEVEKQLQNAIRLRPLDPVARSLLGQVMAQTNRPREAITHFEKITNRSAEDSFHLAEAAAAIRDTATARAGAAEALRQYREAMLANPDSMQARHQVVKCQVFLEQFEEAVRTLQESPASHDLTAVRRYLARVYATWAELLGQQKKELPKQIELIEVALQADPECVVAYNRLSNLLAETDGEELEKLRAILQRMLAIGRATPLVHLCMGTDRILHDQIKEGVTHLELAYRGDPTLIAAINNLAWAFAHSEPPRLDEALAMVDTIISQNNSIAAVHETRGQILVKQKKWKEGIAELELALKSMPKSNVTRKALVEAYESIGMPNMAEEHRKLINLDATNSNTP